MKEQRVYVRRDEGYESVVEEIPCDEYSNESSSAILSHICLSTFYHTKSRTFSGNILVLWVIMIF